MNELKQTIMNDLTKLPVVLDEKATQLLSLKTQLEELKFNVKLVEQKTMEYIEAQVDEDGKKAYPNITKRQTATDKRLAVDEQHQTNMAMMNNLRVQIDNLTLQHQFAQNKFSAAKSMSRIVGDD